MYNKASTLADFKQAKEDLEFALSKREKNKFYKAHKEELEKATEKRLGERLIFVG